MESLLQELMNILYNDWQRDRLRTVELIGDLKKKRENNSDRKKRYKFIVDSFVSRLIAYHFLAVNHCSSLFFPPYIILSFQYFCCSVVLTCSQSPFCQLVWSSTCISDSVLPCVGFPRRQIWEVPRTSPGTSSWLKSLWTRTGWPSHRLIYEHKAYMIKEKKKKRSKHVMRKHQRKTLCCIAPTVFTILFNWEIIIEQKKC